MLKLKKFKGLAQVQSQDLNLETCDPKAHALSLQHAAFHCP